MVPRKLRREIPLAGSFFVSRAIVRVRPPFAWRSQMAPGCRQGLMHRFAHRHYLTLHRLILFEDAGTRGVARVPAYTTSVLLGFHLFFQLWTHVWNVLPTRRQPYVG